MNDMRRGEWDECNEDVPANNSCWNDNGVILGQ